MESKSPRRNVNGAKQEKVRPSKKRNRSRGPIDNLSVSNDESYDKEKIKQRKKRKERSRKSSRHKKDVSRSKKKKRKKYSSSESSSSSSSSESDTTTGTSDNSSDEHVGNRERKENKMSNMENKRLLAKLAARGETLDERKARRSQRRAERIQATLGYTADDNPFNDPNLHETFTWKKRDMKANTKENKHDKSTNTLTEIEKVRKRRKEREFQFEEMERIRVEEARMKELENYDEWARKEEEFHLRQQKQRSAIRLVEGREKPIDVLAKNILLFGLSEQEVGSKSLIKYHEKYNALDAVGDLEAELEEPQVLLKMLKLHELEELLIEIVAFQKLEFETMSKDSSHSVAIILKYWDNLKIVAEDEIKFLKSGGSKGKHAAMVSDVSKIFNANQSLSDLENMRDDIDARLRRHSADASSNEAFDRGYWLFVKEQLLVHLAKAELSDLHSRMLVCQLERLEKRKQELTMLPTSEDQVTEAGRPSRQLENDHTSSINVDEELGDLEEELGLSAEHDLKAASGGIQQYKWQDKYRPRKPRYFNRVKTGYDWNKYNQTHYDKDNPPPKIVQGYKFNIFYPDLIDTTKTPQFRLEPANTDDFCIMRFIAGPPYEDIAFKIVNREWSRSRKRGFKCTFERGVLSLYFNFNTHWYRK